MYCSECGTEQTELAKFCNSCGKELNQKQGEPESLETDLEIDEPRFDGTSVVVLVGGLLIAGVALYVMWWLGSVILGIWGCSSPLANC